MGSPDPPSTSPPPSLAVAVAVVAVGVAGACTDGTSALAGASGGTVVDGGVDGAAALPLLFPVPLPSTALVAAVGGAEPSPASALPPPSPAPRAGDAVSRARDATSTCRSVRCTTPGGACQHASDNSNSRKEVNVHTHTRWHTRIQ